MSSPAPDPSSGLSALLSHAAMAPLMATGWLRVTGEDRVRWLNGMATNSIQSLQPGEGCYNFFLNAQGRIQGDATAWMLEDAILLETDHARLPGLLAMLDHFIIMDDVELSALPLEGLLIAGPDALHIVQSIGSTSCAEPQSGAALSSGLRLKLTAYHGAPVSLIHAHSPLISRYEIWSDAVTIAAIVAELGPLPQASSQDLEHLRLLEGTPLYGTDIRNSETTRDLPQETNQTRALHFSKGCYLGQEIVERIRSRGAVHRTLSGFTFTGELPPAGTSLTIPTAERPVGEITSAGLIPLAAGAAQLGLGYIRRDALDQAITGKVAINYPGGVATPFTPPYSLSSSL